MVLARTITRKQNKTAESKQKSTCGLTQLFNSWTVLRGKMNRSSLESSPKPSARMWRTQSKLDLTVAESVLTCSNVRTETVMTKMCAMVSFWARLAAIISSVRQTSLAEYSQSGLMRQLASQEARSGLCASQTMIASLATSAGSCQARRTNCVSRNTTHPSALSSSGIVLPTPLSTRSLFSFTDNTASQVTL